MPRQNSNPHSARPDPDGIEHRHLLFYLVSLSISHIVYSIAQNRYFFTNIEVEFKDLYFLLYCSWDFNCKFDIMPHKFIDLGNDRSNISSFDVIDMPTQAKLGTVYSGYENKRVKGRYSFMKRMLTKERNIRHIIAIIAVVILNSSCILPSVNGFVPTTQNKNPHVRNLCSQVFIKSNNFRNTYSLIMFPRMTLGDDTEEQCDDESNGNGEDIDDKHSDMEGGEPIVLDDLDWRLAKARLEEQYIKRLVKSKPRFLPYKEARKWVQAWGGRWKTESDWKEWIADGEKRNSYIPARPDEYYTRTGQWISWRHFLLGDDDGL